MWVLPLCDDRSWNKKTCSRAELKSLPLSAFCSECHTVWAVTWLIYSLNCFFVELLSLHVVKIFSDAKEIHNVNQICHFGIWQSINQRGAAKTLTWGTVRAAWKSHFQCQSKKKKKKTAPTTQQHFIFELFKCCLTSYLYLIFLKFVLFCFCTLHFSTLAPNMSFVFFILFSKRRKKYLNGFFPTITSLVCLSFEIPFPDLINVWLHLCVFISDTGRTFLSYIPLSAHQHKGIIVTTLTLDTNWNKKKKKK